MKLLLMYLHILSTGFQAMWLLSCISIWSRYLEQGNLLGAVECSASELRLFQLNILLVCLLHTLKVTSNQLHLEYAFVSLKTQTYYNDSINLYIILFSCYYVIVTAHERSSSAKIYHKACSHSEECTQKVGPVYI